MTDRICTFPDCGRPHVAGGLCRSHYAQRRRGGPIKPIREPRPEQCTVVGCGRPHYGNGLCQGHYQQAHRGAEISDLRDTGTRTVFPTFATLRDKIEFGLHRAPSGHWIWGYATVKGYGVVRWNGTLRYVHRAYLVELGVSVPDHMEVDHLCRITLCGNPMHLDVVTGAVNKSRIPEWNRNGLRAMNGTSL